MKVNENDEHNDENEEFILTNVSSQCSVVIFLLYLIFSEYIND